MLTISGERKGSLPDENADGKTAVHINERFEGSFRRVISLPEDADVDAVQAKSRDGIVQITVQRKATAQPRRIAIQ